MTNYCRDCKHIRIPEDTGIDFAKCAASRPDVIDPVTGDERGGIKDYCQIQRREGEKCGPNGTNFELREGDDA